MSKLDDVVLILQSLTVIAAITIPALSVWYEPIRKLRSERVGGLLSAIDETLKAASPVFGQGYGVAHESRSSFEHNYATQWDRAWWALQAARCSIPETVWNQVKAYLVLLNKKIYSRTRPSHAIYSSTEWEEEVEPMFNSLRQTLLASLRRPFSR